MRNLPSERRPDAEEPEEEAKSPESAIFPVETAIRDGKFVIS
jgi:hypothetical protein